MNIPEFTTQNLYFTAPFQIDDFALLLGGNLDAINISSTRTLISSYFLSLLILACCFEQDIVGGKIT